MNDPTHKIVNGERIELTKKEKEYFKNAWLQEDKKRSERKLKKEKEKILIEGVKNKLVAFGLTEEEIAVFNIKKIK